MFRRLSQSGVGAARLQLAAFAVLVCPLLDSAAARADLVPCTVYICSIQNPLAVTSGSVQAWTTDGEAVVQNSDSVGWSGNWTYTNLAPLDPLTVSSDFSLPDAQTYELASATASLNVLGNKGYVLVQATASNSNPYASDLGGASAGGTLDYQITVLGKPGATSAPADGTPITLDVAGVLRGVALTGPASSGSWSSGSATVTIADGAGNLIFAIQAQGAIDNAPYSTTIMIDVGSVYNVEIDASVFIQGNGGGCRLRRSGLDDRPVDALADDLFVLYSYGIAQDFGLSGARSPGAFDLDPAALGLRGHWALRVTSGRCAGRLFRQAETPLAYRRIGRQHAQVQPRWRSRGKAALNIAPTRDARPRLSFLGGIP